MRLTIQHDLDKLQRALRDHEIKLTKNAIPQAVNRTIVSVQRLALQEISATTKLSQSSIKQDFRLVKTAPKRKMIALIDAKESKGNNLIKFVRSGAATAEYFRSRTAKGRFKHAGVKARAWGKAKTYKGTFIGRVKGDLKVLKRISGNKLRYVVGPSPRNEFIKDELREKMTRHARKRLYAELNSAIKRQLKRKAVI